VRRIALWGEICNTVYKSDEAAAIYWCTWIIISFGLLKWWDAVERDRAECHCKVLQSFICWSHESSLNVGGGHSCIQCSAVHIAQSDSLRENRSTRILRLVQYSYLLPVKCLPMENSESSHERGRE
jgi:hypothetical protein